MDLQIQDKKELEININLTQNLKNELHEELNEKLNEKIETDVILSLKEALRLDYELNYIVGELKRIVSYYNLSTRKLRKSEIIDVICDYELNEENCFFVEKRKQQWFYLKELQNDPFFKKYILIA